MAAIIGYILIVVIGSFVLFEYPYVSLAVGFFGVYKFVKDSMRHKRESYVYSLINAAISIISMIVIFGLTKDYYVDKLRPDHYIGKHFFMISLLGLITVLIPILIHKLTFSIVSKKIDKNIKNSRELAHKEKVNVFSNLVSKHNLYKSFNLYDSKFENDTLYIYDDNLKVSEREASKIFITNDEKEVKVEEILSNIKSKLNLTEKGGFLECKEISSFSALQNVPNKGNGKFSLYNYLKGYDDKKEEFISLLSKRLAYYKNEYNSARIGREGEEYVNNYLNQYENIYNLPNIRVEVPDMNGNLQSIESDNIVISRYGIFVIEVKNYGIYGTYDLIVEKDGRWLKRYKDSGRLEVTDSASSQNERHIIYLNKLINKALNRGIDNYLEVDGMIVIANNKINIQNNSMTQTIVRASEIYSHIKNKVPILNLEEMNIIKELLIKNNLPPKKYSIYDYRKELYTNYDKILKEKKLVEKSTLEINEFNSKHNN